MFRIPSTLLALLVLASAAGCGSSLDGAGPNLLMDAVTEVSEVVEEEVVAGDTPGKDWSDTQVFDLDDDNQSACGAEPYGFGCPCDGNDDCAAGFCVPGPVGDVCTQECLEECPNGWECKQV